MPAKIVLAGKQLLGNKFQVPALYTGTRTGNNVYFDLQIQSGLSQILVNKKTSLQTAFPKFYLAELPDVAHRQI
jgi:hypothetical protein